MVKYKHFVSLGRYGLNEIVRSLHTLVFIRMSRLYKYIYILFVMQKGELYSNLHYLLTFKTDDDVVDACVKNDNIHV